MTTFPGAPRLNKGIIIGIDVENPVASVIRFQYNPETMTRSLEVQSAGDAVGVFETQRLKGAPVETISLEAEFDAADQLDDGSVVASTLGVYPQLSALEMLVYPKLDRVRTLRSQMALGMIEIVPPTGVFTLFGWGRQRVVPVRLIELSITEQAYDADLNPIRATVSLNLRVLSYNDLASSHAGYDLFLAHQAIKEGMAIIGSTLNAANTLGIPTGLL
jgi:hypothetical protein